MDLKFRALKRKEISLSHEGIVEIAPPQPETPFPLIIQRAVEGVNLTTWAGSRREFIETNLLRHGALLFRGFNLKEAEEFEQLIKTVSGQLLKYDYCSTPRRQVRERIYTSTEYPAEEEIPLHNENSYTSSWPSKVWFLCVQPSEQGGETPIADSRKVFKRIHREIREQFIRKKVLYVRNYGNQLDLPWQEVFQTTNKSEVERYCRRFGIDYEWRDGVTLRTRQRCQAVLAHPKTNEMVWFNQAHLFHISSLRQEAREYLLSIFSEDELPRNAYFGDGSPIEESILDEIREVYQQEAVSFGWQKSDILLLDNILVAHGRSSYTGSRRVLVGLSELSSC